MIKLFLSLLLEKTTLLSGLLAIACASACDFGGLVRAPEIGLDDDGFVWLARVASTSASASVGYLLSRYRR